LSAGLPWARMTPAEQPLASLPALYVNQSELIRRGFDVKLGWLSVGWMVVLCGVTCAALLLWSVGTLPAPGVARTQLGLGGLILAVSILHLSLMTGVLLTAAAGVLIITGALGAI